MNPETYGLTAETPVKTWKVQAIVSSSGEITAMLITVDDNTGNVKNSKKIATGTSEKVNDVTGSAGDYYIELTVTDLGDKISASSKA